MPPLVAGRRQLSTVGILHPGLMGTFIASGVVSSCAVHWVSEGRSAETRARATEFVEMRSLVELVSVSDAIICVCPPGGALSIARQVAASGFSGLYIDANAVSPTTMSEIVRLLDRATVVDGAVIGGPNTQTAVLHLSGEASAEAATLFAPERLRVNVIGGSPGAASALKVCYALTTKVNHALLLEALAAAGEAHVEGHLVTEWNRTMPGLADLVAELARTINRKAWRYVGEMWEGESFFASMGRPGGYFQAAAETFDRLSNLTRSVDLTHGEALRALSGRPS